MAKEKNQLPEGVTAEMVAEWKEKYGALKRADLQDENGEFLRSVVMRTPTRKTIGEFEKWVDKQPNKAKEILVNGTLLLDKEAVKADDVLFSAAFSAAVELIPMGKFTLADL
jgi:hypothetical protein